MSDVFLLLPVVDSCHIYSGFTTVFFKKFMKFFYISPRAVGTSICCINLLQFSSSDFFSPKRIFTANGEIIICFKKCSLSCQSALP